MKSVVTGGAGFIGHHLVRALVEAGEEVAVIDNYAGGEFPERKVPGATYHALDIAEAPLATLEQVMERAAHVFHLAALPRVQHSIDHPAETEKANVGGTIAVLEAARRAGVRKVVFASSSSVYGEPEVMPLHEGMPLNPMSPYAKQKETAEWYCRMYAELKGLPTVCLRFFNVYGPGADPNGPYALVVAKFLLQRLSQKELTITGDGTQTRDFTHVRDVVRGMMLAAAHERVKNGEAINIGGGRSISVNEVAALIGGPKIHVEKRLEPHDTQADISRARDLLGWEPAVPFEEGMQELKRLHDLA